MVKIFFIHYVVKIEKVEESENLTRELFVHLKGQKPDGVMYTVYRMGENVFIHIAGFANEGANLGFSLLPAVNFFLDSIKKLLIEEPVLNDVKEIDFYIG
jgi:hypothetical protein